MRERRVKRPGNAGDSEVSYAYEGKRRCEGSTEGMTERKEAWDSDCTEKGGEIEKR